MFDYIWNLLPTEQKELEQLAATGYIYTPYIPLQVTKIDMDDFDYLQELTKLQETIRFIDQGPYTSKIIGEEIVIYDKHDQPAMAFGKYWIEK